VQVIVVHGGAGENPAEGRAARSAGVERAADAGADVLARGGSALDAVEAAVVLLEDDPCFNAGVGSVLTDAGTVEMDASIMDGDTLRAGAVGVARRIRNAVRAARAVMHEEREVLLVGEPVEALALRQGLAVVDESVLVTRDALERWRRRHAAASGNTVGAVARDARGHVAAATSTGGVSGKRQGRVGDSAVIGAGTYADDRLGAVSATGPGEAIIRLGLARVVLAHVAAGVAPDDAAARGLDELRRRTGAAAGLIVVAPDGRTGVAFTTPAMPAARRG
jgi:beta-aspartyl-peptidase (threonine type)